MFVIVPCLVVSIGTNIILSVAGCSHQTLCGRVDVNLMGLLGINLGPCRDDARECGSGSADR